MISSAELLDAIVDAVGQLTPAQRRQLQRRLYVGGFFAPDTLLTDQQRLVAAPALGDDFLRKRTQTPSVHNPSTPSTNTSFVEPTADEAGRPTRPAATERPLASFLSAIPPATISPAPVEQRPYRLTEKQQTNPSAPKHAAPYRSPISGKIVVGSPTETAKEIPDPHLMPPLPGQAPERPLILVIERGSYMLRWPAEAPQRVRLTFKATVTEQEALYDTLIGVLETVEQRLLDTGADPQTAHLDIRSADQLFVQQVRGEIPCEDIMLQVRRNHALDLLADFADWRLVHQG